MYFLKNMCCLCLNESNAQFNNLCSTDENRTTYLDKISSSITRIAHMMTFEDYLLCAKCCEIIDMIYQFNRVSLKNIETFNSYKGILNGQLEKKRCHLSVKLDLIKNEIPVDERGDVTDSIAIDSESLRSGDLVVKTEEDNDVPSFDDYYESNFSEVKIEIETSNLKQECFDDIDIDVDENLEHKNTTLREFSPMEHLVHLGYFKKCIVPGCINTNYNARTKLFLSIPKNKHLRELWLKEAKRTDLLHFSPNSHLYCCEDHFNLEEDMLNYWQFKLMPESLGRIKIKPGVVPHIFKNDDGK